MLTDADVAERVFTIASEGVFTGVEADHSCSIGADEFSRWCSSQRICEPFGNPCRCLLDWIGCKVRIAGGGLNLTVTQKLADHRQAFVDGLVRFAKGHPARD